MPLKSLTFAEKVRAGWFHPALVELAFCDAVAVWHKSTNAEPLHTYLGFTWEEYKEIPPSADYLRRLATEAMKNNEHPFRDEAGAFRVYDPKPVRRSES